MGGRTLQPGEDQLALPRQLVVVGWVLGPSQGARGSGGGVNRGVPIASARVTWPSPDSSAAPRSPERRWWVKNEPRISADSRELSPDALEVIIASPVLVRSSTRWSSNGSVGHAALLAEECSAATAVDDDQAHVGAQGRQSVPQLTERQALGPQL